MQNQNSNTMQWQGQIHIEHERTTKWYIGATITVLALIAFSIFIKSWSFLLVILVGTVVYAFVHNKSIPPKTVTLNSKGLRCGETSIYWQDCMYFWLIQYNSHYELHLRLKSRWKNDFSVQTGEADTEEIRAFLREHLEENTEHHEKKLDMIARLLKI